MSHDKKALRVLVPVADGSEDVETASITDVLARSNIAVVTVSCNDDRHRSEPVTFMRGMTMIPNGGHISDFAQTHPPNSFVRDFDAIVFPGGMPGAATLGQNPYLVQYAKEMMHQPGKIVAAICAAPAVALAANGLLDNVPQVTCFPFMKDKITHATEWKDDRVVVSTNTKTKATVITSQGPGTALLFGLQVAAHIVGEEAASKVAQGLLVHDFKYLHGASARL